MNFIRPFLLAGLMCVTAGCASLNSPPPKCDGYAKRPLNRSMWEWNEPSLSFEYPRPAVTDTMMPALAFAKAAGVETKQIALLRPDDADSYRDCETG